MTISEAMQRGIIKLRKQHWAFEDDRIELQQFVGKDDKAYYGPWATLVSPQSANKAAWRGPQEVLILGDTADDWVEYTPAEN